MGPDNKIHEAKCSRLCTHRQYAPAGTAACACAFAPPVRACVLACVRPNGILPVASSSRDASHAWRPIALDDRERIIVCVFLPCAFRACTLVRIKTYCVLVHVRACVRNKHFAPLQARANVAVAVSRRVAQSCERSALVPRCGPAIASTDTHAHACTHEHTRA